MNDELGNRMKEQYEDRTRYSLPRRTYTIIRVDGKAFHTYTRGFARPYDTNLMTFMNGTAQYLCEEIQGAEFAYVQSDEISVLLTDFAKITTDAWFNGCIQKMVSVSAGLATARFNKLADAEVSFDSRVFTIPDPIEVENYFIWRQQDATRNSVSMAAQAHFSHKQLHGVTCSGMQEMLFAEKGINWNDYPWTFKRGRICSYVDTKWTFPEVPIFTQDRTFLRKIIPVLPSFEEISTPA